MAAPLTRRRGGVAGYLAAHKGVAAALALAVLGFLYLRSRANPSSAAATAADPTVPPGATGGALPLSGAAIDTSNLVTTDSLSAALDPVALALEGLSSGLTGLAAQQANDEAAIQSNQEAAAQQSQSLTELTTATRGIADVLAAIRTQAATPAPTIQVFTAAAPLPSAGQAPAPATPGLVAAGAAITATATQPSSPVPEATLPPAEPEPVPVPDTFPGGSYDPGYTPGPITAPTIVYQGLLSPGGGTYQSGGGVVTYQSNKGKTGKKPLQ